jgi:hypothetical protein
VRGLIPPSGIVTIESMRTNLIDPRTATEEVDSPTYRAYFSSEDGATEEWQIHDAESITDVLTWAGRDGRTFDLFVEWPRPMGPGLIRLASADRG